MRGILSGLSRRWLQVTLLALLVVAVVGGAVRSPAPAYADPVDLVSNGGFESPGLANMTDFITKAAGVNTLEGWTIGGSSIDHIRNYWTANAGSQSIDLDGTGVGAVSQTLATVSGSSYVLSFAYSSNPDRATHAGCNGPNAGMDVKWGDADAPGAVVDHVEHPPAGHQAMNWTAWERTVQATSGAMKLEFASKDTPASCPYGIALDSVSLIPVPVAAAPAPTLFGAVPSGGAQDGGVAGLIKDVVTTSAEYDVSFFTFTGVNCDGAATQLGNPVRISTGLNQEGIAGFAINQHSLAEGLFVRAKASRPGGPLSDFSNCVPVEPNNTSWPSALALDPGGTANNGFLRSQGEARWFKVPIRPNGHVDIALKGLPADYDLVVFSDIKAAYDALTAGASAPGGTTLTDLAKQGAGTPTDAFNTSQYNPSSWDPTNWDPTLNSAGFSASQWSPSQWSPSQWSASQWSPSQWSASQWSPSQWSASQWSPSQWSPSQWSASQWSPSQWSSFSPEDPELFSNAQTTSLLAVSAGTGTGDENVSINTWNNTGDVYIRVQGKNGSFDPNQAFTLSAKGTGTSCSGVIDHPSTPTAETGTVGSGYGTIILTDRARMQPGQPFDSALDAKLATFGTNVNGKVIDVDSDGAVRDLNAQADLNKGCPYAKNLAAAAIKRIVDAYRAKNPVKYVVVVGGDGVIPFFRYADPSLLANETLYSPPVRDDSASQATLRLGYILNQDAYGSKDQVSQLGTAFPVPDLPVGRLVETPAEIGGLLDAFNGLTNGVTPTPTTSLVTGYDFLQDAADEVETNLSTGIGGSGNATLITKQTVAPTVVTVNGNPDRDHSWTAADLRKALLQSGRHDLIFLAGHFSANDALAADYATNVLATELAASATDFVNAIVFSAGCHSGYNIVNDDAIPNVTEPLDWAQAFAQKKATFIGGTGYQYGDTDFLAYSERIYAEFSRQLRVESAAGAGNPVAVGDALVRSKRIYLKTTPALSALDAKALLEATLFGLPMLSVDLLNGRITEPDSGSAVPSTGLPVNTLGLRTADKNVVTTPLTAKSLQLKDGPLAKYLIGPDGQVVIPTQPILPLVATNVTAPDSGYILRGAGFLGGTYTDTAGVTPLTAAPATELRGIHAPFFTDVFFPVQPWSLNYFDAIGGSGSTRLAVTPVQHITDPSDPLTSTRRQFSNMNFRLFYSNHLSQAALAAAPTITGVETSYVEGTQTLTFKARVVGDVTAGIQAVWVTWTNGSTWQSLELARDPSDESLWTGSMPVADPAGLSFMVQAVNGVGRVALDTNVGSFYRPGSIPGAPTPSASATETTFTLAPPSTAVPFGGSFTVKATVKSGGMPLQGRLLWIGIGSSTVPAFTGGLNGEATAELRASVTPGTYPVTASFTGDASAKASAAAATVTVKALPTTLQLSGATGTRALGSALPITATLLDTGNPVAPLHQRAVFVIIKRTNPSPGVTAVVSGKTDPLGRVDIPASTLSGLSVGNYDLDAYFNGAPAPVNLAPDDVDYGPSTAHATVQVTALCAGPAPTGAIVGGPGNDTINGTAGNDLIYGQGGNDKINGKGGNDVVCTLSGNDTITTGEGNDTVIDTGGTNSITTGGGKDQITTGAGTDTITSGEGDDIVKDSGGTNTITTGGGADQVTTGSGTDTINSGEGSDVVTDAGGTNNIATGGGEDRITTGSGTDSIDSGEGGDVVTDAGGTNTITTGGGADQVTTGSGTDSIDSGEGDDVVTDAGGTTTITSGGGADRITTGSGTDSINSGEGNDTVIDAGGTNNVSTAGGNDTVTTGSGNDTISGGGGDDTINAGDGANTVNGNDGNDRITTGSGNDRIDGGAGTDSYRPGAGTNTVTNCETLF